MSRKLSKSERSLIKDLYRIGAIKFGNFTLKSGKKSPYYIDLRILSSYPSVLSDTGKIMGRKIRRLSEEPNRLCGIPAAGLAIANAISLRTGIPVCYTRKEPTIYKDLAKHLHQIFTLKIKEKTEHHFTFDYRDGYGDGFQDAIEEVEKLSGFKTHGITRYVDGEMKEGDKILLIDDLITTATSKLEARDLVHLEAERRKINVDVTGVYVLIDREQGGKETLEKEDLPLYSIATIREVASVLKEDGILDEKLYKTIVDYTLAERKTLGLE